MEKKVILVNFTGKKDGGALDSYEMTKALIENEKDVVAVISESVVNLAEWKELQLRKLVIIPTYATKLELIVNTLKFPFQLRGYIKKQLRMYMITDIICPMPTFWTELIWNCFPKARKIVFIHDPISHSGASKIERIIFERQYKRADAIVVHSKKFVDYVGEQYKKPVKYIPLGRHNLYRNCKEKKHVLDYDESKVNFLFFGRITPYKGLDVLADAYEHLCEEVGEKISLTIVGNGDFTNYEQRYQKLKNTKLFIRWIPDEEVESFFMGSNLVTICPYKDATQSGVVLLSLDYGIPVIASNTGAIDEQIENETTGLLIEPNDANALEKAMLRLVREPELRVRMGENAYSAAQQLDWNVSANELCEYIDNFGEKKNDYY